MVVKLGRKDLPPMVSGPAPNGKLPETSGMARAFSAWGLVVFCHNKKHASE